MNRKVILFLICAIMLAAIMGTSCRPDDFYKKEVPKLKGLTEKQLICKYGTPNMIQTHTVEEFTRSPEPWRYPTPIILSMSPADITDNLSVKIKSLSWDRGRIVTTAWLHRLNDTWVAFYVEEWNTDVIE